MAWLFPLCVVLAGGVLAREFNLLKNGSHEYQIQQLFPLVLSIALVTANASVENVHVAKGGVEPHANSTPVQTTATGMAIVSRARVCASKLGRKFFPSTQPDSLLSSGQELIAPLDHVHLCALDMGNACRANATAI